MPVILLNKSHVYLTYLQISYVSNIRGRLYNKLHYKNQLFAYVFDKFFVHDDTFAFNHRNNTFKYWESLSYLLSNFANIFMFFTLVNYDLDIFDAYIKATREGQKVAIKWSITLLKL